MFGRKRKRADKFGTGFIELHLFWWATFVSMWYFWETNRNLNFAVLCFGCSCSCLSDAAVSGGARCGTTDQSDGLSGVLSSERMKTSEWVRSLLCEAGFLSKGTEVIQNFDNSLDLLCCKVEPRLIEKIVQGLVHAKRQSVTHKRGH